MGSFVPNLSGTSDPVNFIPAETFFAQAGTFQGPQSVVSANSSSSTDPKDPLRYGVQLIFDDGTTALIQYVMPTVWRIRYNPDFRNLKDYPDANSKTIVQDSFSALVDVLQDLREDGTVWRTKFELSPNGSKYIFSSIRYASAADATSDKNGLVMTTLNIFKDPFSIQATRALLPEVNSPSVDREKSQHIVWQTNESTFQYGPQTLNLSNIVLNVKKPGSSGYVAFGEQPGDTVLKQSTFMNYYCYDNAYSNQVYGVGPSDQREPLYHSDPYMIELNNVPGYANMTATFIDNYSQVAVDLGRTNSGNVGLGVRFGTLDTYIFSADQASEIIWLHTGLIGRSHLKPRYILGHHQGCYGYLNRGQVENVVDSYRASGIPLDGMHIDVDFQDQYRTFTSNPVTFPNVPEMFSGILQKGVKCCTNITPIISLNGGANNNDYPTLKEALEKGYFVSDERYSEGTNDNPLDVRYINPAGNVDKSGIPIFNQVDPNSSSSRPGFGDNYNFAENFNSGYPYHGGVSYGGTLGVAGYYPDLNRAEVRDFWGKQYTQLFDQGLEFVWQDMTTPAIATGYGDMKGFPSRLLISSDDSNPATNTSPGKIAKKTAIELWALYSYNLHKATFNGLQALPSRANKRNFIIGRGSFTGMHRYAGLWTGDNASTWSFWQVCIAQILNLGYSGLSIAGVDMGGFMPDGGYKFCDPDLLIRWYSGAFMLPWYRNHYISRDGAKWFQEPYNYTKYLNENPQIQATQGWLYSSVEPICRYYVQLRYSLMQMLYDSMFENVINGLPIARSLLISDPNDTTLFNESAGFLNNEYIVRNSLLICPVMESHEVNNGVRPVYLPQPDNWYDFNLRIDGTLGVPLDARVKGGSTISYNAYISNETGHMPYVTPIYVREGSIIPQLEVRQYVGGTTTVNPFTIHVYPGKATSYSMYLDDGVSRSSAPEELPQYRFAGDNEAKGEYREVSISHTTTATSRTVTLESLHDNYDPTAVNGSIYNIAVWRDAKRDPAFKTARFTDRSGSVLSGPQYSFTYNEALAAAVLTVPVNVAGGKVTVTIAA